MIKKLIFLSKKQKADLIRTSSSPLLQNKAILLNSGAVFNDVNAFCKMIMLKKINEYFNGLWENNHLIFLLKKQHLLKKNFEVGDFRKLLLWWKEKKKESVLLETIRKEEHLVFLFFPKTKTEKKSWKIKFKNMANFSDQESVKKISFYNFSTSC